MRGHLKFRTLLTEFVQGNGPKMQKKIGRILPVAKSFRQPLGNEIRNGICCFLILYLTTSSRLFVASRNASWIKSYGLLKSAQKFFGLVLPVVCVVFFTPETRDFACSAWQMAEFLLQLEDYYIRECI
jgi:hypothetical protein